MCGHRATPCVRHVGLCLTVGAQKSKQLHGAIDTKIGSQWQVFLVERSEVIHVGQDYGLECCSHGGLHVDTTA